MGFDDFKKKWTVCTIVGNPKESIGHQVTIAGAADNVTVTCNGGHSYPVGTYQANPERIQGSNYTIKLNGKCSHGVVSIKWDPAPKAVQPCPQTPSWTAEDKG
jgi:hypothetical protein